MTRFDPFIDAERIITCAECGSAEVQVRVTGWYPANEEIIPDATLARGDHDDFPAFEWDAEAEASEFYCPVCGESVDVHHNTPEEDQA